MIGFLKGIIISNSEHSLIMDVNGVGYLIRTPLPLLVSIKKEDEISLYIHTHVREDQITLYGFRENSDLFLFEKLIGVSGIGPKSALAMLSVHSPTSIASAVEREDVEALSHTPGVGKKTAQKIILELKGKLNHLLSGKENDSTLEVRLALEALGYSSKEVHDALQKIKIDTPTGEKNKTTSALIKEALSQLQ